MAPPRLPLPDDFAAKFIELDGDIPALAKFYGVNDKTVRNRWVPEIEPTLREFELADIPKGRPAEMLRERKLDPDEWQVSGLSISEWEVTLRPQRPTDWQEGDPEPEPVRSLNRRTRLNAVPRKPMLKPARPDGWKRPKLGKLRTDRKQLAVICGDQHAPEHDRQFHAKFLSWLSENQPTRVILLGDLLENADVSRWQDRDGQATVKESIDAAYYLLRDYIDAAPDAHFTWIEGNHDQRVETYAANGSPKLAKIARAGEDEPVLSIPHLMRLDELRVDYVTGYPLSKIKLTDKLAVIHGKAVRKGAGATALANLEKRGHSVISGHTHRAGVIFKTVMDIDDTPSTLMAAETGTMKEIKPEVFDEAPDHQNAFVTAVIYPDGQFHLEPAIYSAGYLRWRDQRW